MWAESGECDLNAEFMLGDGEFQGKCLAACFRCDRMQPPPGEAPYQAIDVGHLLPHRSQQELMAKAEAAHKQEVAAAGGGGGQHAAAAAEVATQQRRRRRRQR
jgi:hypothetical protein